MRVLKDLIARLEQWLRDDRAIRYPAPGMVAYYWDGAVPRPHPVKDISVTGAYLYGANLWQPGTVVTAGFRGPFEPALTIAFRVVRQGTNGIGISFVPQTKQERQALQRLVDHVAIAAAQRSVPGEINRVNLDEE